MKKIFSVLCASVVAMTAVAANPSDLKVYINPGHGGYDSDDRVMTIHPFADGDTATFAESKSNLGKGFRLRELLWEKGYNVEMSRVRNTTDDDLGLSTIVALSNKSGADLFLSIHSNATGVVNRRSTNSRFIGMGYLYQPTLAHQRVNSVDKHKPQCSW